jgi:type I restriction enzyme S subunit
MATNQGFKSLLLHDDRLDAAYLCHWLKANRAHLQSLGNGATFKELSKAALAAVEIPLPPLAEQRRVAALLEHAESVRAAQLALLAGLDELTNSLHSRLRR